MAIRQKTLTDGSKRYFAAVYVRDSQKYIYGSTRTRKRDALSDETKLKHELYSGSYIEETTVTFDEAVNTYFNLLAVDRLSEGTLKNYQSLYVNHLEKTFGHRTLVSIRPYEIQQLWKEKSLTLANSTIIKAHTLMNNVYKQYVKWDEIKNNPLDKVDKPRTRYRTAQIWTKEEAHTFLETAKEYQSYMVFWLALNTGMRSGEILGLTWDSIDFENNLIIVKQQYSRSKKKIVYHTKTSTSMREIDLSHSQMDVLINHKNSQNPKSNIVCSNEIGGFIQERNVRRAKKVICDRTNVKLITFHELRHTHASMLVNMDEPLKYVQERLGHSDAKTTMNFYVHTQKSHHRETAERFSNYFLSE